MKSRVVLSFLVRSVLIVAVSEAMVRLMIAGWEGWFDGTRRARTAADGWRVRKSGVIGDCCPKGRMNECPRFAGLIDARAAARGRWEPACGRDKVEKRGK